MVAPARALNPAPALAGAGAPIARRTSPAATTAALALQHPAGNRAAARVLGRWTKHPDPKQKGIMVPDVVASEFAFANPPKNAQLGDVHGSVWTRPEREAAQAGTQRRRREVATLPYEGLARAIGNRAFVRVLSRRDDASTAPTTDRDDRRFARVGSDLTWSQWGWEAMGIMDRYGLRLVLTDSGAPASFLPDYNRCVINLSGPSYEVAAYFVHEMYHAERHHTGRSPAAKAMGRDDWVNTMVTEEMDGSQKGFLHKLALEHHGRAPADDRPVGMNYFRGAYEQGRREAERKGPTGVDADDAGRANARRAVAWLIKPADGSRPVLGPNAFDSYGQYYIREWNRLNPSSTP